jgi:AcrR family transcriptional regulator
MDKDTRQFIIEKSAPVFNKKGIAGTFITDIMEKGKVKKGGVYFHFESKDEIAMEAFNFLRGKLAESFDQATAQEKTAKGKLFALLDTYERNARNKDFGGCPLLNFGTESDDTHPAIKKLVKDGIASFQQRIATIVSEGIAMKEFSKKWDAENFSIRTFAMIEGGIFVSRVVGNTDQMKILIGALKSEINENCL